MRFGYFLYPMCFDDSRDSRAIDECLYEAELVEELDLDAVWLAEHHFVGEVVYGDPLLFAAAVAVKTRRVLLGLAVVEMALNHPVRVAIHTALLDNLSHGRLIVGTGRGSSFNAFEYTGFGVSFAEGKERMAEAEDLLVKAWTTDNLDYNGKFWQVKLPSLRPRPYQKPHPPLARACLSDESVVEMAKKGKPVLINARSIEAAGHAVKLYRDSMLSAGFAEPDVEKAVSQSWLGRDAYLAETDDQALDEFLPALERANRYIADMRERWNPKDQVVPAPPPPPLPRSAYQAVPDPKASELLIGSPRRVAEQVAMLRDLGVKNLMVTHRGLMSREQTTTSLRLLAEKVMPLFR